MKPRHNSKIKKTFTHAGIRCLKCKANIFSMFRHDFKYCPCGAVAVDGGFDYTRVSGNREDWEVCYTKVPVSKMKG